MIESNEIRRLLDLMEATQTRTKEKTTDLDDFDIGDLMGDYSNKGDLTTSAKKDNAPAASKIGKSVGKADTSRMSQDAMSKLDRNAASSAMGKLQQKMADAGMQADDDDFDMGAVEQKPQEPNTLPANIRKDMATVDEPQVTWHNLPDTPGYRMVIGAFGPLFKSFGMDPKQTKVSTTLTTGEADMRKLVAYLNNNATKDDKFSLEAFDIDPEHYHIEGALMYHMAGETYMVIKERLGQGINFYVYSAPDEGHRHTKGIEGGDADMKQIG